MHLGEAIYLDVLRVLHILVGITWIGILYYFNLIQGQAFAAMDVRARQEATVHPRTEGPCSCSGGPHSLPCFLESFT